MIYYGREGQKNNLFFPTEKRFVEITVVFQGYKGFNDVKETDPKECYDEIKNNQDKIYVCNYR